jgi:hypothetical protein
MAREPRTGSEAPDDGAAVCASGPGQSSGAEALGFSELGPRPVRHRYEDPTDRIWLATAAALGMTVRRTDAVFASWDGASVLQLSTVEGFDPDDSLAQLILHEICHALVEAPQGWSKPDWGLENIDERDLVREHACHRLQAALADAHGLRLFFAVTTLHRPYYDALPAQPLAPGPDPAIPLARAAMERARAPAVWEPLQRALEATAQVAAAVAPFVEPASLWSTVGEPVC